MRSICVGAELGVHAAAESSELDHGIGLGFWQAASLARVFSQNSSSQSIFLYLPERSDFNSSMPVECASQMSAVSEIMSARKTVRADRTASVLDAANLMVEKRVGSIVITDDDGKPIGIITERDILKKVTRVGKLANDVAVQDIMSSPVISVKAFDSIDTAAATMSKNKIKRLVVLEQNGTLSGVLSVTDITRKLAKILTDDYQRYGQLKIMLDSIDK